jgi:hypothetical protein
MWSIEFDIIGGAVVGIEFPAIPEEVEKAFIIDLLIFRWAFIKWKEGYE